MSGSLDTLLKEMPFEEAIRVAKVFTPEKLSVETIEDWKNLDRSVKERVLRALQRNYRKDPFTTWPTFSEEEIKGIDEALNENL